jgi:hypothetical protein
MGRTHHYRHIILPGELPQSLCHFFQDPGVRFLPVEPNGGFLREALVFD